MPTQGSTVERRLARIARKAHGVVTRAELRAAGVTPAQIHHRVRIGALIRVHQGVYRVGHQAPSVEATYLAAVKAAGTHAVLSGRAAAWLLGLLGGPPPPAEVGNRTQRRIPGVVVRRRRELASIRWRGVPVTTVALTLIELTRTASQDDLVRACHEAEVKHGLQPEDVETILARTPRSPGAARLQRILRGDTPTALSRLEKLFLEHVRKTGLPLPRTNLLAGKRRVDCRWPDARLTVELDSYRFHNTRQSWERDRQREREARGRGDEFRRYTWTDVVEEPVAMLADLRRLLCRDIAP